VAALARPVGGNSKLTMPELDGREAPNSIVVETELPAVEEKDVSVTLASGVLTINCEKMHGKEEKGESYDMAERSFSSLERPFACRIRSMTPRGRPNSTKACSG
jgi:HSP20 family molecular chaperone IbpA